MWQGLFLNAARAGGDSHVQIISDVIKKWTVEKSPSFSVCTVIIVQGVLTIWDPISLKSMRRVLINLTNLYNIHQVCNYYFFCIYFPYGSSETCIFKCSQFVKKMFFCSVLISGKELLISLVSKLFILKLSLIWVPLNFCYFSFQVLRRSCVI